MDFKKILKVITTIVALAALAAAAYVAVKKLMAKDEPEYFDDNDFFECDNEIEIIEVNKDDAKVEAEAPAEEKAEEAPKKKKPAPKKKAAPKKAE